MEQNTVPVMMEKPRDLTLAECEEAFAMFRAHKAKKKKRKLESDYSVTTLKKKPCTAICNVNIGQVINLGMPHVGEQIFSSINTKSLIQCLSVSKTWNVLAKNTLIKRWKSNLKEACEVFKKACETGQTEIVKLILKNVNIDLNAKDEMRETAFKRASKKDQKDVIKVLLDHSTREELDVNARSIGDKTAFMVACEYNHKDIVQIMLDHPRSNEFDFNALTAGNFNGFMHACLNGHKDIVQIMLDHARSNEFDFNVRSYDSGSNGFMMACRFGHIDVVKLLLDHSGSKGIDFNQKDRNGKTGFVLACQERVLHHTVSKLVRLLLEHSHIVDVRYPRNNDFPKFVKKILRERK